MLEIKKSSGGVSFRNGQKLLAHRLQEPEHGFKSYGQVQQWLAETLGVEAEYHAVYQMTRYRLKPNSVVKTAEQ